MWLVQYQRYIYTLPSVDGLISVAPERHKRRDANSLLAYILSASQSRFSKFDSVS